MKINQSLRKYYWSAGVPLRAASFFRNTTVFPHPDHYQAAEISINKCEAVHGKDNCGYSAMKTKHGTAFCTGYDDSVYGH